MQPIITPSDWRNIHSSRSVNAKKNYHSDEKIKLFEIIPKAPEKFILHFILLLTFSIDHVRPV